MAYAMYIVHSVHGLCIFVMYASSNIITYHKTSKPVFWGMHVALAKTKGDRRTDRQLD